MDFSVSLSTLSSTQNYQEVYRPKQPFTTDLNNKLTNLKKGTYVQFCSQQLKNAYFSSNVYGSFLTTFYHKGDKDTNFKDTTDIIQTMRSNDNTIKLEVNF